MGILALGTGILAAFRPVTPTMLHLQRLTVTHDYPVYFGTGVFSPENPALAEVVARREPGRRHRVAFVVEKRVADLWPSLVERIETYAARYEKHLALAAAPLLVPGGEDCKNDSAAPNRLLRWFDELGMDRQSFVVIVGGGALLDMAGFAAATAHRGLRVIRVPTTVLSQNDSGVGVKNGVNAFGKKNFIGTFSPPFAVLNDASFLDTLDRRDKVAGMAEAVKVALVKDRPFFEWIANAAPSLATFERDHVAELIRRCAVLHLDHIAGGGDPFETGSSRPLDFGHWAAHKLESMSDYELRHGEAVAIGLALDSRYSVEAGLFAPSECDRIVGVIEALGLPTWDRRLDVRGSSGRRVVLDGVNEFREHLGGDLTVMMLAGIGRGREVTELDEAAVEGAIRWLAERAAVRVGVAPELRRSSADTADAARG
jgi:3-dehydroquinate synthase